MVISGYALDFKVTSGWQNAGNHEAVYLNMLLDGKIMRRKEAKIF